LKTCNNFTLNLKKKNTAIAESNIPNSGYGLFSLEKINKDEFISEYTGEVLKQN